MWMLRKHHDTRQHTDGWHWVSGRDVDTVLQSYHLCVVPTALRGRSRFRKKGTRTTHTKNTHNTHKEHTQRTHNTHKEHTQRTHNTHKDRTSPKLLPARAVKAGRPARSPQGALPQRGQTAWHPNSNELALRIIRQDLAARLPVLPAVLDNEVHLCKTTYLPAPRGRVLVSQSVGNLEPSVQ